jgi:hypothetical protein
MWQLTVKLRGRTEAPDERRGRTLSPRARGANQTTPHGPLQRLLGCDADALAARDLSGIKRSDVPIS